MHTRRFLIIGAALLTISLSSGAQKVEVVSRVVRVIDGDTIDIFANGKKLRIRFEGVDCPETGQSYGSQAKDFTARLLQDRMVTVRLLGAHENRIIARVFVDGRDVSAELVRAGMAWHYAALSKDQVLAGLEKDARARKIGLWSQPNPMPPWDYRRYSQKPTALAGGGPYRGNVDSRIFHRPGCTSYLCKTCTRIFATREEALRAGYKPCRICKP